MNLAEALAALHLRVPLGMRLGLEPMLAACARAAHPERAFSAVHVAGTNGKGSTSAMVESIARAAGLRTGLYTSPHLCRFAERIRIGGTPITEEALADALTEALVVGADLSFFETATLAAFMEFRRAEVDLAIVEVGLGGRFDATNVLPPPRCAAITSIGLDHQAVLGDTLDLIAREKAAIAKAGAPLVLGPMPAEARAAAIEVATASVARIVEAAELPADVVVGLAGAHQRDNARVAWTIAGELAIGVEYRTRGLAEARWPGRLERIDVREGELAGAWLLDGAHNRDGAAALVRALAEEDVGALVFGALADKGWVEMLRLLGVVEVPRYYVAPKGRTAAAAADLAIVAAGKGEASVEAGLRAARRAAGARTVVVAGSLYLVGEARAHLLGLAMDPIVAL